MLYWFTDESCKKPLWQIQWMSEVLFQTADCTLSDGSTRRETVLLRQPLLIEKKSQRTWNFVITPPPTSHGLPLLYSMWIKSWLIERAKSTALHTPAWIIARTGNYFWSAKWKSSWKKRMFSNESVCLFCLAMKHPSLNMSSQTRRPQDVKRRETPVLLAAITEKPAQSTVTPAFSAFAALRGHAVSRPEMRVHPDSCRESIYTGATDAEWDIMFSWTWLMGNRDAHLNLRFTWMRGFVLIRWGPRTERLRIRSLKWIDYGSLVWDIFKMWTSCSLCEVSEQTAAS